MWKNGYYANHLEEKEVKMELWLIPICLGRHHGDKPLLMHLVFVYFCPNPGATDFIHPTDRKLLPRDDIIGTVRPQSERPGRVTTRRHLTASSDADSQADLRLYSKLPTSDA